MRLRVLLALAAGRSVFFSPERSGLESEPLDGLEPFCPCGLGDFGASTRVLAFSLPLVPAGMLKSVKRCSELE